MSSDQLTARRIDPDDVLALRSLVLRDGAPLDACRFDGDEADDTIHVGAFDASDARTPIAIASLYVEHRPANAPGGAAPTPAAAHGATWRLRGMATHPAHRRRGAAAAALREGTRLARAQGATLLWCNARLGAVDFYRAHGWRIISDEFDLPGIGPHVVMDVTHI